MLLLLPRKSISAAFVWPSLNESFPYNTYLLRERNCNRRAFGNKGAGEQDGGVDVANYTDDVAPTGSVRQVYWANSNGAFTVNTTVVDWITLSHPESYYADGTHGFVKIHEAIVEGLDALDAAAPSTGFDFTAFDLDENGALDGLGIFHSGHGAEFWGDDCHGTSNADRIWSHKGGLDWTATSTGNTTVKANRYYASSALHGTCDSNIVRMGVICHELGHYLGLPDLYDYTFQGKGLGAYDFMSQSWGWDGSGLYPPNLSAWSKLSVGWAEAEVVEYDGVYELAASVGVVKITHSFPAGEYLLLENRQPTGYDSLIPQGGIAIYHVDEQANGQMDRGYPGQTDDNIVFWPENGLHYKVALLSADGGYDLELGNNEGDAGDLWHAGSAMTELSSGQAVFPNTDTYQNGVVHSTGWTSARGESTTIESPKNRAQYSRGLGVAPAVGLPAVPIAPVPPAASDDGGGAPGSHRPHPSYRSLHGDDGPSAHIGNVYDGHERHQERQGRRRLYHAPTGSFQNLVLLLRFSDHANRVLPSQSDIDRLYNSEDFDVSSLSPGGSNYPDGVETTGLSEEEDVAPTGSVRQVFLSNSHGAFTINTTVVDWIILSKPESYYAAGNHGFSKFKEAIAEALTHLDSAGFDFTAFDVDENGALDGFGILHSGHGAEFAGKDCHGAPNDHRIWSHKGGVDWVSAPRADGATVRANRYYVSSSLRGKCHSKIVRMGVVCHELGHYLGLPDQYDGSFDGTGLGAYDFMSQSWGWDGTGLYPPNLSAWSKLKVGWANEVEVEYDGHYELDAAGGVVYKIASGFPAGEYLLLENRQAEGYDAKLAAGGIAIYHVDEQAKGQSRRGYPGQTADDGAWPENGRHYEVALLGADGRYDLERGENQGDGTDLWHADSSKSELASGGDHPNTDAYQDGIVVPTGIRIYGFSASGSVMSFSVAGLGAAPTDAPTKSPVTESPTKAPTASPSEDALASSASAAAGFVDAASASAGGLPTPSPTAAPTASPSQDALAGAAILPEHGAASVDGGTLVTQEIQFYTQENPQDHDVPAGAFTLGGRGSPGGYPQHNGRGGPVVVTLPTQSSSANDGLPEPPGGPEVHPQGPPLIDPGAGATPHEHHAALDGMTDWQAGGWSASDNTPEAPPGAAIQPPEEEGSDIVTLSDVFPESPSSTTQPPTEADDSDAGNNDDCPYYPGWEGGFAYCLADCHQPFYMRGNPVFEFDSADACCARHFRGVPSCRVQSLAARAQVDGAAGGATGGVSGWVWDDENANHRQDWDERTNGRGVAGALVELFACAGRWVRGTRTAADGGYAFAAVAPGRYFVQITPTEGYRLADGKKGRNGARDSDFGAAAGGTGRSACFDLERGGAGVSLDAGLIADGGGGADGDARWYADAERASGTEGAASGPQSDGPDIAAEPSTPLALTHSKSGLRGSVASSFQTLHSYEASDATMVAITPTDDATVHSDESVALAGGNDGELRVGPNGHGRDEILLKFDVGARASATRAVLRLYSLAASPSGGAVHVATSNDWDEHGAAWATAPAAGAALAAIGTVKPHHWAEVDITDVLAAVEGEAVTLRIASAEGNHSWTARYASRESGEHPAPELRIYF
ncbi:hypothetical protein ACHAXT_011620 [Thalassiosira profunda]